MRNHKGLTLEEMIWWLAREGGELTLSVTGAITNCQFENGDIALSARRGSALAAVGAVYDQMYGDEECKVTVRNLFSHVTGGLINSTRAEEAAEVIERSSE